MMPTGFYKKLIVIIALIFALSNLSYAKSDIYWPDKLYKDGEPDYADGDLEDKLGDSGYYYDLFPEERDEPDDNISNNSGTKTDINNPKMYYYNNIAGYYNNPNSLRNNSNFQIIIKDSNDNTIGATNIGNSSGSSANYSNAGFKEINGNIYYIKPDGTFKTGWLHASDKWYYFDLQNSALVMNQLKEIDNRVYYFQADGVMACNTIVTLGGMNVIVNEKGECGVG